MDEISHLHIAHVAPDNLGRSKRFLPGPQWTSDYVMSIKLLDYGKISPSYSCFLRNISCIDEPLSLEETIANPNWTNAME